MVMVAVSEYDLPRKLQKDPLVQKKANEWLPRAEVRKLGGAFGPAGDFCKVA